MSKKTKSLLIGGIIIVCLIAVFAILKITDNSNGDDSSEPDTSVDTSTVLYEFDKDNVARITISNEYGDYDIVRKGIEKWSVEGFTDAPDNTALLGAIANNAAKISTQEVVEENAENLAKYGLDDEKGTKVSVKFRDEEKTEKAFIIGDVTPQSSNTRYFRVDGSNTVYTTTSSGVNNFLKNKEAFVSLAILEEPAQEDWPIVNEIKVDRTDLDYTIKMIYDDSTETDGDTPTVAASHIMVEPINAYLDLTTSVDITHGLWGLSASEVMVVNPTDEQLKEYGLDEPFATVSVKAEQNNYQLTIGNADYMLDEDGNATTTVDSYYGYFEGFDVIYKFSASSVKWATFKPMDIVSSLMTGNYIFDVEELKMTDEDGNVDSLVMANDREEITSAKINGNSVDTLIAQDFYGYVLLSPAEEMHMNEPTGERILKLEIIRFDGDVDTIEFFRESERTAVVKLNGKVSFSQKIAYLNKFMENLDNLKNGNPIEQGF